MMGIGSLISLIVIVVLLLFSALISGCEVAFFSLTSAQLKDIKNKHGAISETTLKLLENPKELLATILIGNNLANVGIVIISTYFVNQQFDFGEHPFIGFFIQVIVITFLILLFGEITPKAYATLHAPAMAMFMAYPIMLMKKIFRPVSAILIVSTSFIDKRITKKGNEITADDLSHAIDITKDDTATDKGEKILKGIVKFGKTDVKQVMTQRLDVVAFEISLQFNELRKKILESGFSRIPVYKKNFDQIEGVLYIKDMLPYLEEKDEFNWRILIRKPFFVPETKKIDDLLREFQEKKMHLAIVVDEYGGSSGIITLEDIIEEVVGEITDEFDEDETFYDKIDNRNYIFEGKTHLKDFYRILHIDGESFENAKGEADTIAGFVIELAGKIPLKNEKIEFEDYLFTVEASDKRRVKKVKVTIQDKDFKDKP